MAASISHCGTLRRLFARIRRASQSLHVLSAPKLIMLAGKLGIFSWMAEGMGALQFPAQPKSVADNIQRAVDQLKDTLNTTFAW